MKRFIGHLLILGTTIMNLNGCTQTPSNNKDSSQNMPISNYPMTDFPVQVPFNAAKTNQTATADFWVRPLPDKGTIDAEFRPNQVFVITLNSTYHSEESDSSRVIGLLTQQKRPLYKIKVYRIDTVTPQLQPLFMATLDNDYAKPATSDFFFPSPYSGGWGERDYALAHLRLPRNQVGHYRAEITTTADTPELSPFAFKFSIHLDSRH